MKETTKDQRAIPISESELKEKSRIYGKNGKPLTKFQGTVNEACYQLCAEDGSLIFNKGKLLSLARERVHSAGYNYAKKSSRSQVFGHQDEKRKRKYVHQEVRQTRMKELSESISSQRETIQFLQQQKVKFSNTEKFLEAAEINKSILEENMQKRKLELELQQLNAKEMRSKTHQAKKKRKMVMREETTNMSTDSDDTVSNRISSDEESLSSNDDTPVMPRLQRSTAVRCPTTSESETHLITNHDSLNTEKEDPGENPSVISGDEDPDSQLSCAKGELVILDDDATTVVNKEQSFLGL
jgi:hypothetical protein